MNNAFVFGRISKLRKKTIDGPIAQLAEHGTENAGVGGPIPPWATTLKSMVQLRKKLNWTFFLYEIILVFIHRVVQYLRQVKR